MKKNVLTKYKAAIIYGIFAFFICVNIVIVATHVHAAQVDAPALSTSTAAIVGDTPTLPVVDTPTMVPVPTPTLVPTDTPIPVYTPTPVPTQPPPPPDPTPTPVPAPTPKPTQQPLPPGVPTVTAPGLPPSNGGGLLPGMTPVPSSTPGAKATPGATATPTDPVEATPTVSASTSTNNSISNQGKQEGSGIGTAIVPVAIGSVLLLLIGGLTCFMFLRKPNAQQLAYAGAPLRATGRPARFNHQGSNTPFATPMPIPPPVVEPQGAFAAASIPDVLPMSPAGPPIPMPAHTNRMVITPTSPSAFASGPQPTVTMPTGLQPDLLSASAFGSERLQENEAYMPSDLKPITTPLPKLVTETAQRNPISTSDMNPLPLDNFDLSQVLPQDNNGPAHNQMIPAPVEKPQAFSPLIAPSIQDDPVLETIMRQAQMGLYALPNPETPDSEESL